MSRINPVDAPPATDPTLVLAMLANHIPLTLLLDLAWLNQGEAADFTPLRAPC